MLEQVALAEDVPVQQVHIQAPYLLAVATLLAKTLHDHLHSCVLCAPRQYAQSTETLVRDLQQLPVRFAFQRSLSLWHTSVEDAAEYHAA